MRIRHCIIPVLLTALLCQWAFGNLQPHRLGFPLNGALSLAFLAGIWVMANEWGKKEWMHTLRSGRMACTLLACIAVWCVVGGLVPPHAQARWLSLLGLTDFTTSWPFVALLVLLLVQDLLLLKLQDIYFDMVLMVGLVQCLVLLNFVVS